VNGALLVDKPAGITSHDAVAICRRALGSQEGRATRPAVGHTGTLDPFATGLLVVLVGKATRLSRFLDGEEKVYHAVVRLGVGSDTDDSTGALTPSAIGHQPSAEEVRAALEGFVGTQMQMPPAFSAKKVDGQRAYDRARKGEEVVLKQVEVTIHSIELLKYEWPDVELRASVSTGTYIRSLARDLGKQLGTLAHCAELRRERIGRFAVDRAATLDLIQNGSREQLMADGRWLMAPDVVGHLARRDLTEEEVTHLSHGRSIEGREEQGPVALVHGTELIGIGECAEGRVRPVVVLAEVA
jgi:tRNA pseudouridine55 synthase